MPSFPSALRVFLYPSVSHSKLHAEFFRELTGTAAKLTADDLR